VAPADRYPGTRTGALVRTVIIEKWEDGSWSPSTAEPHITVKDELGRRFLTVSEAREPKWIGYECRVRVSSSSGPDTYALVGSTQTTRLGFGSTRALISRGDRHTASLQQGFFGSPASIRIEIDGVTCRILGNPRKNKALYGVQDEHLTMVKALVERPRMFSRRKVKTWTVEVADDFDLLLAVALVVLIEVFEEKNRSDDGG